MGSNTTEFRLRALDSLMRACKVSSSDFLSCRKNDRSWRASCECGGLSRCYLPNCTHFVAQLRRRTFLIPGQGRVNRSLLVTALWHTVVLSCASPRIPPPASEFLGGFAGEIGPEAAGGEFDFSQGEVQSIDNGLLMFHRGFLFLNVCSPFRRMHRARFHCSSLLRTTIHCW